MRRRLSLLIGAHKTASTHLQRSVTDSRAALAPHGVGVIGPMPIGADILPLSGLLRGRADPEVLRLAAEGFLSKHVGDAERVVLMNENILGSLAPNMLLQDDRLYKFAPGRVKRVVQLFETHDIQVGVAIRAPGTFLVSAWQENMKGHAFHSFRQYLGHTDLSGLRWHRMIKRMQQALGEVKLFVWRFEDYPQVAPKVLQHCMGDAAGAVTLRDSAANPGFSGAAIDWLAAHGEVSKDSTREALQRFPKGTDFPAYDPWSDDERGLLDRTYDQDCAKLAEMPGVTLIRP